MAISNYHKTGILFMVLTLASAALISCPKRQSQDPAHQTGRIQPADNESVNLNSNGTSGPNESTDSLKPVMIDLKLTQYLEGSEVVEEDGSIYYEPPALLFDVLASNPNAKEGELFGVNLLYEAKVKTGVETLLLQNPLDESSDYISDEHGPIKFEVVEIQEGKLENTAGGSDMTNQFFVPLPEGTVAIKYWAEVVIKGGDGESVFSDEYYVTVEDAYAQGGIINPEDVGV